MKSFVLITGALAAVASASQQHEHLHKRDSGTAVTNAAVADFAMIKNSTDALTATISSWDGTNLTDALAISAAGTKLVDLIGNLTASLKKIPGSFSSAEAFDIGAPTQSLAYSVNASIAALIKQKPAFEKLGLDSTVVMSLNQQMNASAGFSSVLLALVPSDVRPVADALNSQITDSLTEGINCFSGMNQTCYTAVANPNRTRQAAEDSGAIAKSSTSAASRTANVAGLAALVVAVSAAVFAL